MSSYPDQDDARSDPEYLDATEMARADEAYEAEQDALEQWYDWH